MPCRCPPPDLLPDQICPNPAHAQPAQPAIDWRTYECELVTPMFGGGVKTRTVDQEMPVRPSAIRGQLRFWWRLLAGRGGAKQTVKLRQEEFDVWGGLGSPPKASKVWVRVEGTSSPHLQSVDVWTTAARDLQYALFPAQASRGRNGGEERREAADLAKPGLRWTLHIGLDHRLSDEQRHLVLEAVRWWASFGGVGARTRRGMGAVLVRQGAGQLPPVTPEEAKAVGCELVMARRPADAKPEMAWRHAVACLQAFRQGQGIGRRQGGQRPGRSYWPEPDAIRRLARRSAPGHEPFRLAGNLWPRAYFGLPIIFHFKDEKFGDPRDHTLQPSHAERLASPVILRPLPEASGQGAVMWRAAALRLPYGHVQRMQLKFANQNCYPAIPSEEVWPSNPDQRRKAIEVIEPMKRYGQWAQDPLQAFLKFFESWVGPSSGDARRGQPANRGRP